MKTESRDGRVSAAVVGVVVAIATAALSVSRTLPPGAFNEASAYLALGRALASGAGYHSTYLVGSPPQLQFPPAYPALLAILWGIGRTSSAVRAMAVGINVIACGVAAALFWQIARQRLRLPTALVATFVVLPFVIDPAIQYFTLALPEPLIMLAMAAAFLLVDERESFTTGRAVGLGAIIAIAALLGTQGLVLLAAVLLALLIDSRGRRKLAIVASVSIIPVVAWFAYVGIASRQQALTQAIESTYTVFFAASGHFMSGTVMKLNAFDYLRLVGAYINGAPKIGVTLAIVLIVPAIVGVVLLFRKNASMAIALIGNAVIVLAWPAYQDRWLLATLPLAGIAAAYAINAAVQRLAGAARSPIVVRWENIVFAVVLVLLVVRQYDARREIIVERAAGNPPFISTPSYWLPANASFVDTTAQWTLRSTAPTDRIAIVSPAGLWLYTGRQTVPMQIVEPRIGRSAFDIAGRYLASQIVLARVSVVLVDGPYSTTGREVTAISRECPSALRQVDEFAGITAWRTTPDDPCVRSMYAGFEELVPGRKRGD